VKTWCHALAAAPLAGGLLACGYDWRTALFVGLVSVLVDLDHVPDYLIYRRGWKGLSDFFAVYRVNAPERLFYGFHAWEWPILTGLLALAGLAPSWLVLAGVGVGYHVLFDSVTNRMPRGFYFLLWRAGRGFVNPTRLDRDH